MIQMKSTGQTFSCTYIDLLRILGRPINFISSSSHSELPLLPFSLPSLFSLQDSKRFKNKQNYSFLENKFIFIIVVFLLSLFIIFLLFYLFLQLQFGALTPLEPRLGKKLIEPLTNLIHRQVYVLFPYQSINQSNKCNLIFPCNLYYLK